ncbi:TOMM precursor leader peptide-binding protein [Pseudonocardia saturnea]
MSSRTGLPPLVSLAPHRSLLPVGPRARRIGLCPEQGFVVDDLDPALALMLDELTRPVDPGPLVARAVRRGADPSAATALLAELLRAGALVGSGPVRIAGRREHAVVLVVGDGPLAAGVVTGLVGAGVGRVHVQAVGTVTAADLGTGLLDADRGTDRAVAIAAAAARAVPGVTVTAPPRRLVPDLVVLADAQAPRPGTADRLAADGTAHLPVRLRDGVGVVGPLVLPGRTACLRCLDRWRTERDPGWPGVAAQLAGRPGSADRACVAATAALGTAQALAALDDTAAPPTLDTTIELDLGAATLVHRRWERHPGCPCGGARHPRATCGVGDVGGRLES